MRLATGKAEKSFMSRLDCLVPEFAGLLTCDHRRKGLRERGFKGPNVKPDAMQPDAEPAGLPACCASMPDRFSDVCRKRFAKGKDRITLVLHRRPFCLPRRVFLDQRNSKAMQAKEMPDDQDRWCSR